MTQLPQALSLRPGQQKSESERIDLRSGDLGYIGRLWPFLSLHNLKLYLVALLQALIAFSGDGAVMNEDIRSIITPKEAVTLCVVEPLDRAFQSFHVRPHFLAGSRKRHHSYSSKPTKNVYALCCSPEGLSRLRSQRRDWRPGTLSGMVVMKWLRRAAPKRVRATPARRRSTPVRLSTPSHCEAVEVGQRSSFFCFSFFPRRTNQRPTPNSTALW